MKRSILVVLGSLLAPCIANADEIVHAKRQDTIGCTAPDVLSALKRQMKGTIPQPEWEERIQSLGCYPVATDLNWRVASREEGIVHLQLDMEGVPMPSLWFDAADIAKGPGVANDKAK